MPGETHMNIPRLKQESLEGAAPAEGRVAAAKVHRLPKRRASSDVLARRLQGVASVTIPPLIMLAVLLLIWEMATAGPGSSLPSPVQIWTDARDLIVSPFFNNGPQD